MIIIMISLRILIQFSLIDNWPLKHTVHCNVEVIAILSGLLYYRMDFIVGVEVVYLFC